ncbi:MAG: pentapeptide repeat-containing protein [Treponema sp.]|nr:pentapeptide repeat-containing protein [Treponema sp.]
MFTLTLCAAGCGRAAITGSQLCAIHAADPEREAARIGDWIQSQDIINDLSAPGLHFENLDFSYRRLYGCNFKGVTFSQCIFIEAFIRLSFFDFASFIDCDFTESDLQFLSFAGSRLKNCTFAKSELVHLNYGGAVISNCTFNHSNLYNSRFIDADIENSDFINCNIKSTNFIKTRREGVSFKASNTAEAVFELDQWRE